MARMRKQAPGKPTIPVHPWGQLPTFPQPETLGEKQMGGMPTCRQPLGGTTRVGKGKQGASLASRCPDLGEETSGPNPTTNVTPEMKRGFLAA